MQVLHNMTTTEASVHLGALTLPILGEGSGSKQLAAAGPCTVVLPCHRRQGHSVIYLCHGLQVSTTINADSCQVQHCQ